MWDLVGQKNKNSVNQKIPASSGQRPGVRLINTLTYTGKPRHNKKNYPAQHVDYAKVEKSWCRAWDWVKETLILPKYHNWNFTPIQAYGKYIMNGQFSAVIPVTLSVAFKQLLIAPSFLKLFGLYDCRLFWFSFSLLTVSAGSLLPSRPLNTGPF